MRLCDAEGISDPGQTEIFLSCDAHSPMEDTARLSLLSAMGPGSSPQKPVALIVKNEESEAFGDTPEFAHTRNLDVDAMTPEPPYSTSFLVYKEQFIHIYLYAYSLLSCLSN